MRPDVSGNIASKQVQQKFYHDQHSAGRELFIGQRVANLRAGDKWIPGTIMERTELVLYHIWCKLLEDKCGNIILIN